MKIHLKLYGEFTKYGPEESFLELPTESTVSDLLKKLSIEEKNYIIILVNLRRSWFEEKLKEGDAVSIFSPVGGG
jgi:thiamine biosynthesis protein ThiS